MNEVLEKYKDKLVSRMLYTVPQKYQLFVAKSYLQTQRKCF